MVQLSDGYMVIWLSISLSTMNPEPRIIANQKPVGMKNIYALFSFLFLVIWGLRAQPTCADPELVLEDDIENYASGDVTLQSPK